MTGSSNHEQRETGFCSRGGGDAGDRGLVARVSPELSFRRNRSRGRFTRYDGQLRAEQGAGPDDYRGNGSDYTAAGERGRAIVLATGPAGDEDTAGNARHRRDPCPA